MLLRFFNNSFLSRLFALIAVAVLLWLPSFLLGITPQKPLWMAPLYELCFQIPVLFTGFYQTVALIMVLLTALLLNYITVEFGLSEKTSYLPAFLYLVFTASLPEFTRMNPFIFTNFFITLYILSVFRFSQNENVILLSFNGGFYLGIASLFYPPLLWMIVVHFAVLFRNRINNLRAYVSALTGLLLPFVFLFTWYYWNDTVLEMKENYMKSLSFHFSFIAFGDWLSNSILILEGGFILAALIREYRYIYTRKINERRNISVLFLVLAGLFALYLFYAVIPLPAVLLFVPAVVLINDYLRFIKKKKLAEIVFLLLFILIFVNRYFQLYYASWSL